MSGELLEHQRQAAFQPDVGEAEVVFQGCVEEHNKSFVKPEFGGLSQVIYLRELCSVSGILDGFRPLRL